MTPDTPPLQDQLDRAFLLFFGAWVAWGMAAHFLLYRGRSAAFRRRWHPVAVTISATAFLAFVLYIISIGFPRQILNLAGPALLVFLWLNLRHTRFCDACGKQNFRVAERPRVCRACRRPL